ncbi:PQQ-like beta-propeller repeat protein [Bdellovibrio bacteriovorus]|uniref:PQQ-binding-like beta-propeller repeat protein n=1 Tax=Bdellovibrio bacteriovorus TaxID=959 RepID=UPI0021D19A57|nr:PQQ-binding-like beta-propeller repeat protein [Bdellovibrio bacteriovorus]UXR66025.1 PQQ-like beta-propeller repeat protein [Bdellovibrio bacteriovorus]
MKMVLALYSLLIAVLLVRAEVKTWPLLGPDWRFAKLAKPAQGATVTYDLSPRTDRSAQSTYRSDAQRSGRTESSLPRFKDLSLLWKIPNLNNGIHRASKSSPAVDPEGFYIADDTGFVRAYNWQGELRWQFYSGVSSRGFHSTPLTDQDSLYIGDYAGFLYSLNKSSGQIRWITKTGVTVGSSPLLHAGVLYVGVELADPDGYLLAIEARSGRWIWTSPLLGNHPHSSPSLSQDGQLLLMGSNTGAMAAYDLHTGKNLWSFATNDDIKCSALINKDRAYFTSWDGFLYAVDNHTGKMIWKTVLDGSAMSCPSLNKSGDILIITGFAKNFAIRTANGTPLWDSAIVGRDLRAQASPLIISYSSQEVAITLCENRSLCVQDVQSGTVLQKVKMQSDFSGSPVYWDGKLLLSTSGEDGLLVLSQ